MKKILIVCLFGLCLSGCAAMLVSGGVITGVAISKDSVRSGIEAGYDKTWSVALDEVRKLANIKVEDKRRGIIEASSVSSEKIVIKIREITPRSCEILVKSRKNLLPNITLAHELSNKISNRVK